MVATGNYNYLEIVLFTSIGAAMGVFIFYHGGEIIFNWIDRVKPPKKATTKVPSSKVKRMMIKVKNKYGIGGLMMLSGLISVPITAILAAKYFRRGSTSIAMLSMGFFIWSNVLTGLSLLFKFIFTQ